MNFIVSFVLILSMCAFTYAKEKPKDKLYVCAIFNNEARFLNEWIEFHIQQGADKIYLYNNHSTDDYPKVLYKYIRSGIVHFRQWPYKNDSANWTKTQCDCYMDCVNKVKGKVEWVAFIDTDEFLFSPLHKRVCDVLDWYADADAVGVNWVMYGTSNVEYLGDGRMTQNMTLRAPLEYEANKHIKTIVRPDKVKDCANPHYFLMKNNSKVVNENNENISGPFSKHSSEILRINHYWLRDKHFMKNEKARRRGAWYEETVKSLMVADLQLNQVYDPILKNFVLD
jgi:hypothetical protein